MCSFLLWLYLQKWEGWRFDLGMACSADVAATGALGATPGQGIRGGELTDKARDLLGYGAHN